VCDYWVGCDLWERLSGRAKFEEPNLEMRWLVQPSDSTQTDAFAAQLRELPEFRGSSGNGAANVLAQLLLARGVATVEHATRFLNPSLDHLHSPYDMLGMAIAVARLEAAIERREDILIYGDYDVDGTTAIVILKTAIELCGGTADFHVPHRIRDGYGMKDDIIEQAAAAGVKLIISVDTGIRAFAAAETARRLGIDLIVTDHHLPGPEGVPHACAVLNPNQAGCPYPTKVLCGAGVAFKLAQALLEKTGRERLLPSFLKIAAIGTIADVVPLTGENRVFAKLGLAGLRNPVNAGLKALFEVAKLDGKRALTATDIGFRIAPRINAAGRMDVARSVIDLFSTKDTAQAREIAGRLDQLNAERQDAERKVLDAIARRIEGDPALRDTYCIVVDGDGWHRGVIGIAATRIVERYCRPTLVISLEDGEAHGSGRSIRGFHLLNAIESCAELFTRFGGHSHACGFSLPASRVPELRQHLDTYAREHLTEADFEQVVDIHAELPLEQVTDEFFRTLERLEPFGMGNPEPVFVAHAVRLDAPPRVIKEKHISMKLSSGAAGKRLYKAMGWRLAERVAQAQLLAGDMLDVAYTLTHNDHPDFGGLELNLRDFRKTKTLSA
jgi:single-stranded-DNA-specific exonuclease